ncbi:MAG TPA: TolC family protein, partial [Myxococcota bacterium]|nr:TolC family protein [Myxococcota bacterium]
PPLAAPIPERFGELEVDGEAQVERWWTQFGDAELDTLVNHALTDNLDLRRALARINQAEALARTAGAVQLPSVTANAGVSGSRSVFNLGEPIGVRSNEAANYSLGVSAAWEL